MTIHDLEIFEKVVECTNLTLLSKRIGMSQPNISIHLKSLEEELNEKLFERIGKKLIINESGKLLHSKTKDFLLQYNEIKNIFSKNKLEGKINIGSTKTLSIYFLPSLLWDTRSLILLKSEDVPSWSPTKNSSYPDLSINLSQISICLFSLLIFLINAYQHTCVK